MEIRDIVKRGNDHGGVTKQIGPENIIGYIGKDIKTGERIWKFTCKHCGLDQKATKEIINTGICPNCGRDTGLGFTWQEDERQTNR